MPSLCGLGHRWAASGLSGPQETCSDGHVTQASLACRLATALLLLVCCARATSGSLRVEVPLRKLTVRLNDNVTIPCNFSGFARLDLCVMAIRWFRIDPKSGLKITVFEVFGINKNIPRTGAEVSRERLQRGDASLQLPAVQLGDAGEYWCEVVDTPAMEDDSILLEVLAVPTSRVFVEQTTGTGNSMYLVCQSFGFYPEAINITWEKRTHNVSQDQRISTDIYTDPITLNEDGTFNITSYLKLIASLEDTYYCVVDHTSLQTSQRLNCTLFVRNAVMRNHVCILSVFLILLILIVIFVSYCISKR
ncbi:natural cytotoxicity triggering receptor 3 ligand 1-like [Cavia porcellus]|uniref:natural cytotoxicity triggering receptor 3 ligand 1-like n=1 Tax=Cavia porcellus TaxID=10141 RepID=UPI002FE3B417